MNPSPRMLFVLMYCCVFSLLPPLPAQESPNQSHPIEPCTKSEALITLGMPFEDLRLHQGRPEKYFSRRAQRYFPPSEYEMALKIWGEIDDVFSRKTEKNEYEVRISYAADMTSSRLHPKIRVVGITFLLDRRESALVVLEDLAEASLVCVNGCKLVGDISGSSPRITAYPESVALEDRAIAAGVASHWHDREAQFKWVPAVHLRWKQYISALDQGPAIDWGDRLIEEVEIGVYAPEFELRLAASPYRVRNQLFHLGSWKAPGGRHECLQ